MNYWQQISRHFHASISDADKVRQIMKASRKWRNSCAECYWGEPCGYGIKDLVGLRSPRQCIKGLWRYERWGDALKAHECPSFRRHNTLRLFRLAHPSDMTPKALAANLGLSWSTIKAYESGRRKMKYETAQRYADVLGCRPEDLMI